MPSVLVGSIGATGELHGSFRWESPASPATSLPQDDKLKRDGMLGVRFADWRRRGGSSKGRSFAARFAALSVVLMSGVQNFIAILCQLPFA